MGGKKLKDERGKESEGGTEASVFLNTRQNSRYTSTRNLKANGLCERIEEPQLQLTTRDALETVKKS